MNARTELAKTARKMLADENINIPDELLNNLVADDADGTKTAVESFAKCTKKLCRQQLKKRSKENRQKQEQAVETRSQKNRSWTLKTRLSVRR